jgi:hypothetical protein
VREKEKNLHLRKYLPLSRHRHCSHPAQKDTLEVCETQFSSLELESLKGITLVEGSEREMKHSWWFSMMMSTVA